MRMSWVVAGRVAVVTWLGLQACLPARAAPLDADIQRRVREATFEVVLPKPATETLRYDKAWEELIPYQVRSDKYVSIGTAFSIGSGRYVTAMHVLSAAIGDPGRAPVLRDAAGNIYPLGQIIKGSFDQDFVVFTLAQSPQKPAALQTQEKPELNETVYAVGNALGEGIVMREGNYTSDTPEEESGRWKWQRFSAPISGGNSGGPLVDSSGRVVGVVRAMRSSENTLNFAVPISLVVAAPDGVARVDSRAVTGFLVFDSTRIERLKADIPLPQGFQEFAASYIKLLDDFNAGQLSALMSENAADTFPRGSGSGRLLHAIYERSAPGVVVRGGNGTWGISQPSYTRLDLGHEGWQEAAVFKGVSIFHRHRPDDIAAAAWYRDPQVAKELVLKSSSASIHVGGENVKVISMGKPEEDQTFTDSWGRVWQLRIWHATNAFASEWLAEFDLPVPDGTVGFEARLAPLFRGSQLARMKLLANFIVASYEGKLSQWDEFLGQTSLLPKALAQPVLHIDYGHRLAFDDRRFAFSYGADLQKIERDSRLRLDFAFIAGGADAAVLDVAGVSSYDGDGRTEAAVFRHGAPDASSNEAAKKEWEKRLRHDHPYDGVASLVNGRQSISAIYGSAGVPAAPQVLYTFQYRAESGTPQDAMKARLDLLMRDAKVNEP